MRPVVGIAIGSVILAPVSEMYGRRPVYIASTLLFTILIIPCGLATSLPEVVVVRFFGALAGSAMIANRYVHFGATCPCLVANLGHIPPFHVHFWDLRAFVLCQTLGRWTKYSSQRLRLLPKLSH